MRKKTLVVFLVLIFLVGLISLGLSRVKAQSPSPLPRQNHFQALIEAIAQKFGLEKTKVEAVFEEFFAEKRKKQEEEFQKKEEARLEKLLSQGKITREQKEAILKKWEEIRVRRSSQNFSQMTPEERRKFWEKEKEELSSFAQSLGLDLKLVLPGWGQGKKPGEKGFWRKPLGGFPK